MIFTKLVSKVATGDQIKISQFTIGFTQE